MRGLLVSLAVVIAIGAAGLAVASLVYWNVIYVGSSGNPIDYAGQSPPCPKCSCPYSRGDGWYSFRCDRCGAAFESRRDDRNRFVYDWE
jgi:hypothetical protein